MWAMLWGNLQWASDVGYALGQPIVMWAALWGSLQWASDVGYTLGQPTAGQNWGYALGQPGQ